jgi:SAM-dependent methyltransferase
VDDDVRAVLAATFDSAAELYERARPGFAQSAVDWLLPAGARRVLDLGAGTGKLTRQLLARGLDVVAVDPSPNMLAELSRAAPGADTRIGTAEHIGLPDDDVDVVLASSAFHWFTRPAADVEIARVLKPGGTVGLLWNNRRPDIAAAEVFRLGRPHPVRRDQRGEEVALDPSYFGPTEHQFFPHTQQVTPDQFVELVASASYVIAMEPGQRAELLARVRDHLRTHPELTGRPEIEIEYLTLAVRATSQVR